MAVLVYGASDDLIEVEGDVEEEFDDYLADGRLIFSNDVELSVKYGGEGTWNFTVIRGAELVNIIPPKGEDGRDIDGYPNYSEMVTVEGAIDWVRYEKTEK